MIIFMLIAFFIVAWLAFGLIAQFIKLAIILFLVAVGVVCFKTGGVAWILLIVVAIVLHHILNEMMYGE
jgi:hypothetical protein